MRQDYQSSQYFLGSYFINYYTTVSIHYSRATPATIPLKLFSVFFIDITKSSLSPQLLICTFCSLYTFTVVNMTVFRSVVSKRVHVQIWTTQMFEAKNIYKQKFYYTSPFLFCLYFIKYSTYKNTCILVFLNSYVKSMHLKTCNEKGIQMKKFRSVVHTSLMTYLFYTLMTKHKMLFTLICNVFMLAVEKLLASNINIFARDST